jgi:ribosomal protein S18 acetylase RimI-like enzyme
MAQQADCEHVVLAVDAANEPAIRMYQRAGFTAFDRRAVWMREIAHGKSQVDAH